MKRFSRIILIFFLVNVVAFNCTFADTTSELPNENIVSEGTVIKNESTNEKTSATPFEIESSTVNTENIKEGIQDIADKGESLAYKIVEQISDKSLPVCAILILWGSVLYFILGIRNLYKKRQGLLLMWGAFTFLVIAKIMNFVFWFIFMR